MVRFKTEEEFIAEFGIDWEGKVRYGWNPEMDKFFGTEFPMEYYQVILEMDDYYSRELGGWSFSRDMFIEEEDVIKNEDYKVITNGLFVVS